VTHSVSRSRKNCFMYSNVNSALRCSASDENRNTPQITSITGSLTVHCVVQLRLQRQQKLPSRIQRRRRIVRAVGCGSSLRPRPASKPARNGTQTTTATHRSFFAAVCSFSCYQVADGARRIQLVTCRRASGRRVRRRRLMERRRATRAVAAACNVAYTFRATFV